VEAGWNVLVGADKEKITEAVKAFQPKGVQPGLFGDGAASQRIAKVFKTLGEGG